MPKTEADLGTLHKLLTSPADSQPQLVFPEIESITVFKNLGSLPPPLDALPRKDGKPYAVFAIREFKPIPTKKEELKKEEPSLVFSSSGLILVSSLDLQNEDYARKIERRFQRLSQFESLTQRADAWERELDGSIASEDEETTREIISAFRWMAASMYTNELSKDPVSKVVAEGKIQSGLPQEDLILEAAESIIKHASFNMKDVFDEVDKTLNPSPGKRIDEETKKLQSEAKERERQQKPEEDLIDERSIQEEVTSEVKAEKSREEGRESGIIYMHDPEMDEPSQKAAEYFEELWERPF